MPYMVIAETKDGSIRISDKFNFRLTALIAASMALKRNNIISIERVDDV